MLDSGRAQAIPAPTRPGGQARRNRARLCAPVAGVFLAPITPAISASRPVVRLEPLRRPDVPPRSAVPCGRRSNAVRPPAPPGRDIRPAVHQDAMRPRAPAVDARHEDRDRRRTRHDSAGPTRVEHRPMRRASKEPPPAYLKLKLTVFAACPSTVSTTFTAPAPRSDFGRITFT